MEYENNIDDHFRHFLYILIGMFSSSIPAPAGRRKDHDGGMNAERIKETER